MSRNEDAKNKECFMKKIATKVFLISVGLLVFAACSNTKKSAEKTVQEVQDTLPVVVDHLNNIQTFEANLQNDWEDDISDDLTLANYAKKKGKVFDNLQQRRDIQKQITKTLKVIRDDASHLSNLQDKNLPSVEIKIVSSNLQKIVNSITDYIKKSEEQLNNEQQFFVEISGNKLSNDDLRKKIIVLNQAAIDRQKILEEINEPLTAIDKPIRILKARLSTRKE